MFFFQLILLLLWCLKHQIIVISTILSGFELSGLDDQFLIFLLLIFWFVCCNGIQWSWFIVSWLRFPCHNLNNAHWNRNFSFSLNFFGVSRNVFPSPWFNRKNVALLGKLNCSIFNNLILETNLVKTSFPAWWQHILALGTYNRRLKLWPANVSGWK